MLINKCIRYINKLLGREMVVQKLSPKELKGIPLAVRGSYDFYRGLLFDRVVLLLVVRDAGELTPLQMDKHKEWVEEAMNGVAVMVMESLPSYNAQRLMQRKVNFVVPEKQMFIPELLVDLKKVGAESRTVKVIPPIAQVVLLWQLEREGLEGLTTREVADRIGVPHPTMYRSMGWLAEQGLVQLRGERVRAVHFTADGADLWSKALSVCVSPVERVWYTDDDVEGWKAGEEALAEVSMLNGDGFKTRAMTKEQMKSAHLSLDKRYGNHRIEIWRYNPGLLAENDTVDVLSLFLSMKGCQDDRVQIELDNIIDQMPW